MAARHPMMASASTAPLLPTDDPSPALACVRVPALGTRVRLQRGVTARATVVHRLQRERVADRRLAPAASRAWLRRTGPPVAGSPVLGPPTRQSAARSSRTADISAAGLGNAKLVRKSPAHAADAAVSNCKASDPRSSRHWPTGQNLGRSSAACHRTDVACSYSPTADCRLGHGRRYGDRATTPSTGLARPAGQPRAAWPGWLPEPSSIPRQSRCQPKCDLPRSCHFYVERLQNAELHCTEQKTSLP